MNNTLITGANGQLGIELSKLLPNALRTDYNTLDICDFEAVKKYVTENNIDTIINCAAYTAVDKAEDEPELAYKINKIGAENLAKTGCILVHISTDYVFDGTNHKPYKHNDKTNPISTYGKTKLEGEEAVLKNNNAIIIRTSWLYSENGNNFVKTMIRLGKERESINVVCDQIGTPTSATDLAMAIVEILAKFSNDKKGIYHFSNEGACTWYDFACEIMKEYGLNCKVIPIPTSAYPTKAKRPFYSVLDKTLIKEVFDIKIPHWRDSLIKCLKQINEKEGVK